MENKFCFLKGIVDCPSGVIQNCNNMRTDKCPLEDTKANKKSGNTQRFCFLKGLVDCSDGRVQDCNNQRIRVCPLDKKPEKQDPWELIESLRQQKEKPDKKLIVKIFNELMKKEVVAAAMSDVMGPEMEKREKAAREDCIKGTVKMLKGLGHKDDEIKENIMKEFGLSQKEAKKFL